MWWLFAWIRNLAFLCVSTLHCNTIRRHNGVFIPTRPCSQMALFSLWHAFVATMAISLRENIIHHTVSSKFSRELYIPVPGMGCSLRLKNLKLGAAREPAVLGALGHRVGLPQAWFQFESESTGKHLPGIQGLKINATSQSVIDLLSLALSISLNLI